MSEINDEQKRLLQHMLGADDRYLKKEWGFRNHFCAAPSDTKTIAEFDDLEQKGMVTSGMRDNYKVYWATKKGAIAIGFKPYQLKKVC